MDKVAGRKCFVSGKSRNLDNNCQFEGLAAVVIIQLGRHIIKQYLWHSVDPVLMHAEGFAKTVLSRMERLNKVCMEKFVMVFWMVW